MKRLKTITLKGSCQCGQIKFQVKSNHYYPYQLCYCSICRKVDGGGGFAINLSAQAKTLKIQGKEHLQVLHARYKNPENKIAHRASSERNFCRDCGTMLWLFDKEWPELMHPFASCIDSELPEAPEKTHIMLEFKASWVKPNIGPKDKKFKRYPKESIAEWHERVIARRGRTKGAESRLG